MHTDYNMEQQEHHQNIHKECVCSQTAGPQTHRDLGQPNTDDRRPRASSQRYRCSTTSPLSRELARSRDDSDLLFFSSSNSHVQYGVIQLSHGAQGLYSEMSQREIKLHNHDLHDFSSNRSGGAHCLWLTKNPKKKCLYHLVQKIISFHYYS